MSRVQQARAYVKRQQGVFLRSQACKDGVAPWALDSLIKKREITIFSRGVYWPSQREFTQPDYAAISIKMPDVVVCFIDALYFHNLTDHFPKGWVGVPTGVRKRRISFPPVRYIPYHDKKILELGVVEHTFDGVKVKIFDRERAIVDAFYLRSEYGADVAEEALDDYLCGDLERDEVDLEKLLRYANQCQVERPVSKFLEKLYNFYSACDAKSKGQHSFLPWFALREFWPALRRKYV